MELSEKEKIKILFKESVDVKKQILQDDRIIDNIYKAALLLKSVFESGNKLLLCGNGGSTCDAMHIAEEFTGKYFLERPPLPAIALTDASHITCVSNDYGFNEIFSRAVQALGKEGDVLMAISTSGNSENVFRAAEKAIEKKMKIIVLSGMNGGRLKDLEGIHILVPSTITSRIQEAHITIGHIIIELVEQAIYGNEETGI